MCQSSVLFQIIALKKENSMWQYVPGAYVIESMQQKVHCAFQLSWTGTLSLVFFALYVNMKVISYV